MIYHMKDLSLDDQKKAKDYMLRYVSMSPRKALTVSTEGNFVDLSPASDFFQNYSSLETIRKTMNKDLVHYDLVSMKNGKVLGLFYFTIDQDQKGNSFAIYRFDRSNPYEFGKDVQEAYRQIHRNTKFFPVVTYLVDDNAAEVERVKGRGAVYHLSKRYNIMREVYTLKKEKDRVIPVHVIEIQGAL